MQHPLLALLLSVKAPGRAVSPPVLPPSSPLWRENQRPRWAPWQHLSQLVTPPPWKHLITWHLRHMAVSTLPQVSPATSSSGTETRQACLVSSPFLCPPARLWHSYRTKCQSCLPPARGHLLFQMSPAAQAFLNHWPLGRIAGLQSREWPLSGCRDHHQPHIRPLLRLLLRSPVVPGTAEHLYPPGLATPASVS